MVNEKRLCGYLVSWLVSEYASEDNSNLILSLIAHLTRGLSPILYSHADSLHSKLL